MEDCVQFDGLEETVSKLKTESDLTVQFTNSKVFLFFC
jgi:hypothetical protein